MRVLVADDDATSRLVLSAMASKLGHACTVVEDGSRAWELLSSEGIDVLLTDWMMPGLDGPALCRRVRNELQDHYVYIVLITGMGQHEHVLEGMSAGADDYLIKPVDPFAVQTRLVAAERVTALHRQVVDFRDQLEQANIELLERSLTDPLTGLGNRRRMEQDLDAVHARALRSGRTFAVALFDIDHFKLYNDHYGHQAGDEALRTIASCLRGSARSGESVYRYGGEEFLVLLPDCTPDDALDAAERICRSATDLAMPHGFRPSEPPLVTVSGGVSAWALAPSESVTELLHDADEALYRAKSAGRNRVCLAAGTLGRRDERAAIGS